MASVVVETYGNYLHIQVLVFGHRGQGYLGNAIFEIQNLGLVVRSSFREYSWTRNHPSESVIESTARYDRTERRINILLAQQTNAATTLDCLLHSFVHGLVVHNRLNLFTVIKCWANVSILAM